MRRVERLRFQQAIGLVSATLARYRQEACQIGYRVSLHRVRPLWLLLFTSQNVEIGTATHVFCWRYGINTWTLLDTFWIENLSPSTHRIIVVVLLSMLLAISIFFTGKLD
jgi:hypothetical protein